MPLVIIGGPAKEKSPKFGGGSMRESEGEVETEGGDESSSSEMQKKDAAKIVLEAIKRNDAAQLAASLETFLSLCSQGEEGE